MPAGPHCPAQPQAPPWTGAGPAPGPWDPEQRKHPPPAPCTLQLNFSRSCRLHPAGLTKGSFQFMLHSCTEEGTRGGDHSQGSSRRAQRPDSATPFSANPLHSVTAQHPPVDRGPLPTDPTGCRLTGRGCCWSERTHEAADIQRRHHRLGLLRSPPHLAFLLSRPLPRVTHCNSFCSPPHRPLLFLLNSPLLGHRFVACPCLEKPAS